MLLNNISNKVRSSLVGMFILIAYGILIRMITESGPVIMIADGISGLSVMAIAILMYPILKEDCPTGSLIYLWLKITEGTLMIIGGIMMLFPLTQHLRDPLYDGIHLYIFIISAFLFYILLLITEIIPKFISIWGLIAICVLTLSAILNLLQVEFPVLDYFLILIITNEVFLALWLMIKGLEDKHD